MNKYCAIIPSALKDEPRIKSALANKTSSPCQFSELTAEYEYEGEHFCLMHLPYQIDKQKDFEVKFNELLKSGHTDFSFISAAYLHIIQHKKDLSFLGANLWNLNISHSKIKYLNLNSTAIHVSKIKNCAVSNLNLRQAALNSITFYKSHICYLITKACVLSPPKSTLYYDGRGSSFIITKSKIKSFVFAENECRINLEITNSEIEGIDLRDTIFYLSPVFSEKHVKELKSLNLPGRKYFKLRELKKLSSSKTEIFRNFKQTFFPNNRLPKITELLKRFKSAIKNKNKAWKNQHKKFRDIYNLCKSHHMHNEQADYFYLMQYCFEKSGEKTRLLRFTSRAYRWTSEYGQNILRPLFSLGSIILLFSILLWKFYNVDFGKALILSTQQIIKPFSLLYDQEQQNIVEKNGADHEISANCQLVKNNALKRKYFDFSNETIACTQNDIRPIEISGWLSSWVILDSITSLSFLALFILALRWNFKKA